MEAKRAADLWRGGIFPDSLIGHMRCNRLVRRAHTGSSIELARADSDDILVVLPLLRDATYQYSVYANFVKRLRITGRACCITQSVVFSCLLQRIERIVILKVIHEVIGASDQSFKKPSRIMSTTDFKYKLRMANLQHNLIFFSG